MLQHEISLSSNIQRTSHRILLLLSGISRDSTTQPKLGPTADRCRKNSRSCIMRNQEWDSSFAELNSADFAQLVGCLLVADTVNGEAAFGVVDKAEILARLLNANNVHEPRGERHVGPDLLVNGDQPLHEDGPSLAVVESILEAVSDEYNERHTIARFVRTGRCFRSVGAGQFVEQPVRWGAQPLLMLLPDRHLTLALVPTAVDDIKLQ
jgi:hypothetical protein